MYMFVCMGVGDYMCMFMRNVCIYMVMNMSVHMCMCTYLCVCTFVHALMWFVHVCAHTCVHVCM